MRDWLPRRPGRGLSRRRRHADAGAGPPRAPLAGTARTGAPRLGGLPAGDPAALARPGACRPSPAWPCRPRQRSSSGQRRAPGPQVAQRPRGRRRTARCARSAASSPRATPEGERLATAVVGIGRQRRLAGGRLPARAGGHDGRASPRRPAAAASTARRSWLPGCAHLAPRYGALRWPDASTMAEWADAQATTGAEVEVETGQGMLRGHGHRRRRGERRPAGPQSRARPAPSGHRPVVTCCAVASARRATACNG